MTEERSPDIRSIDTDEGRFIHEDDLFDLLAWLESGARSAFSSDDPEMAWSRLSVFGIGTVTAVLNKILSRASAGFGGAAMSEMRDDTRHLYAESSGPSSRWCLRCGLVVEDRRQHDRWHEVIDRAIAGSEQP